MVMTEYPQLLDLYYDKELTSSQEVELRDWLMSDPENLRIFISEGQMHSGIHSILESREVQAAHSSPSRWGRRILAIAAVILVLAGAGMALYNFCNPVVAVLTSVSGDVYTKLRSGAVMARAGVKLRSGTQVFCLKGESKAVITCRDGSSLKASANTQLGIAVVRRQYRLLLSYGGISADIRKQAPNRPFIISTPLVTVTVLGTQLRLSATRESTRLDVTDGLVNLARNSDGKNVEVASGFRVTATEDAEFVLEKDPSRDRFTGGEKSGYIRIKPSAISKSIRKGF